MPSSTGLLTILSAAHSGTGTAFPIEGYEKIFLQLGTDTSCNGTIKFQISFSDSCPAFGSAQSVTNNWDYVDVIDLQNGSSIDGDTGVSLAGTDDVRNLEMNAGGARWICATITAHTAGNWTLKAYGTMKTVLIG